MDPNETLRLIGEAVKAGNRHRSAGRLAESEEAYEEADSACEDLAGWLAKGGFMPGWMRQREAALYFSWFEKGVRS